jgi:hypothetical protein
MAEAFLVDARWHCTRFDDPIIFLVAIVIEAISTLSSIFGRGATQPSCMYNVES